MDRFGLHQLLPTDRRVATIAKLVERGHVDHIVLSHDTMCAIDWYPEEMRASLPDYHYLHIPDDVVPALKAAGVTEEQVRTMTVANPRRIFEAQGAYRESPAAERGLSSPRVLAHAAAHQPPT